MNYQGNHCFLEDPCIHFANRKLYCKSHAEGIREYKRETEKHLPLDQEDIETRKRDATMQGKEKPT